MGLSQEHRLPLQYSHPKLVLPDEDFRLEIGRGPKSIEKIEMLGNIGDPNSHKYEVKMSNLMSDAFAYFGNDWPSEMMVYAESTDALVKHWT